MACRRNLTKKNNKRNEIECLTEFQAFIFYELTRRHERGGDEKRL